MAQLSGTIIEICSVLWY